MITSSSQFSFNTEPLRKPFFPTSELSFKYSKIRRIAYDSPLFGGANKRLKVLPMSRSQNL